MQHTRLLCDLLGIRYPVLQGGMAHISDARLAAAVSEAGYEYLGQDRAR